MTQTALRSRTILCCGAENLTDRQRARLERAIAATNPVKGRRIAEGVLASLPTCPIPGIRRLGKTLKQRRAAFLADFDTGRAATEVPKPSNCCGQASLSMMGPPMSRSTTRSLGSRRSPGATPRRRRRRERPGCHPQHPPVPSAGRSPRSGRSGGSETVFPHREVVPNVQARLQGTQWSGVRRSTADLPQQTRVRRPRDHPADRGPHRLVDQEVHPHRSRYRTVQIRAGQQLLTAEDQIPADLRDALAHIH